MARARRAPAPDLRVASFYAPLILLAMPAGATVQTPDQNTPPATDVAKPDVKARVSTIKQPAPSPPPTLPKTVLGALSLESPAPPAKGDARRAKRFLTGLLPVTRAVAACGRGTKRNPILPAELRPFAAKKQAEQMSLHKAAFAPTATRRFVRGLHRDIARRATDAFGLPPVAMPGLAVLAFGSAPIPSTLANGGIIISEGYLRLCEQIALLLAKGGSGKPMMRGLLRAALTTVGDARAPGPGLLRHPSGVTRYMMATTAATIAHEITHGAQLVACSRPLKSWSHGQRRKREVEADVGGMVLAACAGHPLEALLAAEVAQGIMDAVARSQGAREETYPKWEVRTAAAFKTATHLRNMHRKGRWPAGCAPLVVDESRMLKRRLVMAWLKRISTPKGIRAEMAEDQQ